MRGRLSNLSNFSEHTMKAKATYLSKLVGVREHFARSVHLDRDLARDARSEYYLTSSVFHALEAAALALERPADRAMSLVGPYGAGKSAFCLFLSRLLGGDDASLSGVHQLPGQAAKPLRRISSAGPMLPVPVVGARQPIGKALAHGLATSLEARGHRKLRSRLRPAIEKALSGPGLSPREVADLYHRAASLAHLEGARGIFLVVDELGKFLEHAASHPDQGDIFVLQELAEAAARSDAAPLLVLSVLHQNTESYAQKLGRIHQAEWAKVSQRFNQVPFFPSDAERIDLLGRALEHKPALVLDGCFDRLAQACLDLELIPAGLEKRFERLARAAYPLHPLALLALPIMFKRAGQSNRSVFNFLSGDEPHALGRFLRETEYDGTDLPTFGLDSLFDYAAETLLLGWSGSSVSRMWADAAEAVERTAGMSAMATRALKCIALLGMLREPRLSSSKAVLELALSGADDHAPKTMGALGELGRRKLITFSRTKEAYRVWESGNVDVEGELAQARSGLPSSTTLHVARTLCPPARMIARRHSYETGTLRVVNVQPCGLELLTAKHKEARHTLSVLLCLADSAQDRAAIEIKAKELGDRSILVGVADETDVLRDAASEIAAADLVERNTLALQADRAGRRELALRRAEAEATFRAEWDRIFSSGPEGATWFYRGKPKEIAGPREFAACLSEMADVSYRHAPRLRNELINRRSLSSAAAKARRNLIEAMLTRGSEERLGIPGYPPELSMYECVLRSTALHRELSCGHWGFADPADDDPARLRPCWDALTTRVFADPPQPRPVVDLFNMLSSQPYGITEGVLPVLLCAFMLAHWNEMTLYREGTFIPQAGIADFEVLMRRPELFAVAGCRVTGGREAVVERLARGLKVAPHTVPVVRALIGMVKTLPDYAWRTRRLPKRTLAVRDALATARSPEQLLFHDLPGAVGVAPFTERAVAKGRIERFFELLNHALKALAKCTPDIVNRSRDGLLRACALPVGQGGWRTFRELAARANDSAVDPLLAPVIHRAAMAGDDASTLEAVLALIADRPPRSWTDGEVDRFAGHARALGDLFRRHLLSDATNRTASPSIADLTAPERQLAQKLAKRLASAIKEDALVGGESRILTVAFELAVQQLRDSAKAK
jgi:hypothetical protein